MACINVNKQTSFKNSNLFFFSNILTNGLHKNPMVPISINVYEWHRFDYVQYLIYTTRAYFMLPQASFEEWNDVINKPWMGIAHEWRRRNSIFVWLEELLVLTSTTRNLCNRSITFLHCVWFAFIEDLFDICMIWTFSYITRIIFFQSFFTVFFITRSFSKRNQF